MSFVPSWLRHYQARWLTQDLSAGLIVTVMLIPQSLAYAMLAGLPPQMGLYASLLPLLAYAALGSSMTLAVGPVAVASLMTASALQPLALAGGPEYAALAVQLALISGVLLLAFGLLRLGFLAYFLSHPVISGFITGSAVLIAIGQLQHILGVRIAGAGVLEQLTGLVTSLQHANLPTVVTVLRHRVETVPGLLGLRVDESLFFANAIVVEDRIALQLQLDPDARQVLLICSAVNQIDATALDMLTELERSLAARGIVLMLAEVKGPVMDRLRATELGRRLEGRVFLSVYDAFVFAQRDRAQPH